MDDSCYSLALFLLFLFLISKCFLQKQKQRKNLPPSPLSLPIIGHLHLMKEPLHRTSNSLSDKYGPILYLRLGSRSVVVVSSPSAVEECFTKNDIIFANRPLGLAGKLLNYNNTTLGASPYGQHWRNLRRLTTVEIFSTNRLNMFSGIRREEVQLLLKQLFKNCNGGTAKVELKSRFSEFSFSIMLRMITGKRYCGEDGVNLEFRDIIKEILDLSCECNFGDLVPVLQWVDFQGMEKRMLKLQRKTDVFLKGLIDEHRRMRSNSSSSSEEERNNSTINVMLSLQEANPEYYTDEIIKGIILV
ncbi:hypothetical protein HHK36_008333 [Tetracentron sinense]|uniref:Cytochrome P450 n=1 Tax=Tetracentron sinense TaxID=13715 RepID=A0A835DJ88_TETSI|nr:hypothetical protein HHK36_008333 [Tetracentron sinense]